MYIKFMRIIKQKGFLMKTKRIRTNMNDINLIKQFVNINTNHSNCLILAK